MYVCMYVCIYICMYVCMCTVYIYIYVSFTTNRGIADLEDDGNRGTVECIEPNLWLHQAKWDLKPKLIYRIIEICLEIEDWNFDATNCKQQQIVATNDQPKAVVSLGVQNWWSLFYIIISWYIMYVCIPLYSSLIMENLKCTLPY